MADYDLGTAQGEIILKYDGSGVQSATSDLEDVSKKSDGLTGKLDKAGSSMGAVGSKLNKSVTLPLVAAGGLALKAAVDIDDAYDNIRFGTGAVGEDLDSLQRSFDNVAKNTPAKVGDVSNAIADLNTRMGLTGPTLETLASQMLELGRMSGVETDISSVTGAFAAFKIEGEAAIGAMDEIFQVSQATGVGVNELADRLSRSGTILGQLGFGFTESASLIGVLDKAGVDANAVIASMQRSLVSLARSGEEPIDAFNRVTAEIQGLVDEGRNAEALDLAGTVFGTRGAGQFVAALQSGKLSLDDLTASAGLSGDTILGVAAETADFAEQFQMVKNQATIALGKVGLSLFPLVSQAIETVLPLIVKLADWFGNLSPGIQQAAIMAGALVAAIGPILSIGSKVITLIKGISTAMTFLAANPIVLVIAAVIAVVAAFIYLWNTSDKFRNFFLAIWEVIKKAVQAATKAISTVMKAAWNTISTATKVAWELIKKLVIDPIKALWDFAKVTIEALVSFLGTAWDTIKTAAATAWELIRLGIVEPIEALWSFAQEVFNTMASFLSETWDTVKSAAGTAWELIKSAIINPLAAAWGWIQDTFNKVVGYFAGIWNGVVSTTREILGAVAGAVQDAFNTAVEWIKTPLNGMIRSVNWLIDQLNKIKFSTPSWIPGVGGKSFGISISHIPYLASGGVVSKPTLAVVGDAGLGNPEIVAPRKMLEEIFQSSTSKGSTINLTINNPTPERASDSLFRAQQKLAFLGLTGSEHL